MFMRRPLFASMASAALCALAPLLGGQRSAEPHQITSSNPSFGYDGQRNRKSRSSPATYHRGRRSVYMPHQGAAECLRRRQGGNAMRIRMERAGYHWDDQARQYVMNSPMHTP